MKTITIETRTIKEWQEFDTDVYKKIIEKNRYFSVEFGDWHKFIIDEYTRELEKIGFRDVKFQFSGFWSQGDGASFTGDWCSITRKMEDSDIESVQALKAVLVKIGKNHDWSFSIARNNHRYSHENTVSISSAEFFHVGEQVYNPIGERLENTIESSARAVMQDIYRALEKEYEYLTSDEQIEEILELNEYEFDADGIIR